MDSASCRPQPNLLPGELPRGPVVYVALSPRCWVPWCVWGLACEPSTRVSGGPHGTPRSEVMCEAPSPASLTSVGDRVCLYVGRYVQ